MPTEADRVEEVFLAVLREAPRQRPSMLAVLCRGNAVLQAEVESLLAHHDAASGFPATDAGPAARDEDSPSLPAAIGSYRVLDLLGVGGMGCVYLALQDQPRRRVAVKLIRPGLATPAMLRRFEHEAQVLGRLQHPGIAQIFEAGTADTGQGPQPFFAMELVEGQPLGDYVLGRGLDTRARLELLARICDAAHHAHQKGVIHRDLKPANILVDESGQPKILDFGVARLVEADVQSATLHTDARQLVGTLAYMSPEQCAVDVREIDIRCDVYAMGVVAYELLSGRLPLDPSNQPLPEVVRRITCDEPPPLGAAAPHLRGDVETIIAKALEKDKARRYQSASDLAADIRRWLADEPILARPASTWYRLRKFTRRNRVLVGGATVVFLALSAGVISTAWQAGLAEQQRIEAEQETAKGRELIAFLRGMFAATGPGGPARDSELTVRRWLDDAAAKLDRAPFREPLVEADVREMIAESYVNLGRYDHALAQRRRVLEIRRRVLRDPNVALARSIHDLAAACWWTADYDRAESLYREALDMRRRLYGDEHLDVAESLNHLAACRREQDDLPEAENLYRRVLSMRRRLGAGRADVAGGVYNLASCLLERLRYQEAEPLFREALSMSRAAQAQSPMDVARCLQGLGACLIGMGQYAEAEALLLEALSLKERLLDRRHASAARSLHTLARLKYLQSDLDQAETIARQALEMRRDVLGRAPRPEVAETLDLLGTILLARGDSSQAETVLREALAIRRSVSRPIPWRTALTESLLGEAAAALGRADEAERLHSAALEVVRARFGDDDERTLQVRGRRAIAQPFQGPSRRAASRPAMREAPGRRRRRPANASVRRTTLVGSGHHCAPSR